MEMSWFHNKIILCGPFVGSFEEEVLSFRPFVVWLRKNFNFPNVIVSTHYNRRFLYDENVVPIFKQYSKDEFGQKGHRHKRICLKDYNYIQNDIKDQISSVSGFNKGDIITYSLGYNKVPNISIYQKYFSTVFERQISDTVLVIPDISRPIKEFYSVIETLDTLGIEYKVTGDYKTKLREYNELISDIDYFDKCYYDIMSDIVRAKYVITPCSHWTFLCNLHQVPVFSWGEKVSKYKDLLNFNNDSTIIPLGPNTTKVLYKCLKQFIKRMEE